MEEMNKMNEGVFDFLKSAESVMKEVCDQHFQEEKSYIDFQYTIKEKLMRLERFKKQLEQEYLGEMNKVERMPDKEIKQENKDRIKEDWEKAKEEIAEKEIKIKRDLKSRFYTYTEKLDKINNKAELLAGKNEQRINYWNRRIASDRVDLDRYDLEKKIALGDLSAGLGLDPRPGSGDSLIGGDRDLENIRNKMRRSVIGAISDKSVKIEKSSKPGVQEQVPEEDKDQLDVEDEDESTFSGDDRVNIPRGPKYDNNHERNTFRTKKDGRVVVRITPNSYIKDIEWEGQYYNYLYFPKKSSGKTDNDLVIFVINIYGVDIPFYLKGTGIGNPWPFLGFNKKMGMMPDCFFTTSDLKTSYRDSFYTYYTTFEDTPSKSAKIAVKNAEVEIFPNDEIKTGQILNKIKSEIVNIKEWFKKNKTYEYDKKLNPVDDENDPIEKPERMERGLEYYREGHHFNVFKYISVDYEGTRDNIASILYEVLSNTLKKCQTHDALKLTLKYDELVTASSTSSNLVYRNLSTIMRGIYTQIALNGLGLTSQELSKKTNTQVREKTAEDIKKELKIKLAKASEDGDYDLVDSILLQLKELEIKKTGTSKLPEETVSPAEASISPEEDTEEDIGEDIGEDTEETLFSPKKGNFPMDWVIQSKEEGIFYKYIFEGEYTPKGVPFLSYYDLDLESNSLDKKEKRQGKFYMGEFPDSNARPKKYSYKGSEYNQGVTEETLKDIIKSLEYTQTFSGEKNSNQALTFFKAFEPWVFSQGFYYEKIEQKGNSCKVYLKKNPRLELLAEKRPIEGIEVGNSYENLEDGFVFTLVGYTRNGAPKVEKTFDLGKSAPVKMSKEEIKNWLDPDLYKKTSRKYKNAIEIGTNQFIGIGDEFDDEYRIYKVTGFSNMGSPRFDIIDKFDIDKKDEKDKSKLKKVMKSRFVKRKDIEEGFKEGVFKKIDPIEDGNIYRVVGSNPLTNWKVTSVDSDNVMISKISEGGKKTGEKTFPFMEFREKIRKGDIEISEKAPKKKASKTTTATKASTTKPTPTQKNESLGIYTNKRQKMIKSFDEFNRAQVNEGLAELIGSGLKKGVDTLIGTPKGKVDEVIKKTRTQLDNYIAKYFEQAKKVVKQKDVWETGGFSQVEEDELNQEVMKLREIQKSYYSILDGLKRQAIAEIGNNQNLLNYFNQEMEKLKTIVDSKILPKQSQMKALMGEIESQNVQLTQSSRAPILSDVYKYIRMDKKQFREYLENNVTRKDVYAIEDKLGDAKDILNFKAKKSDSDKITIAKIEGHLKIIRSVFNFSAQSRYY
jgi:hypothetical protein